MRKPRISVKKNEKEPESKEILAEAVVRIGDSMKRLTDSGLNRNAIVVLLHDQTKISKRDIVTVLEGLNKLRGWYCR